MTNIFDERLVLDDNSKEYIIYDEHIVRYELAKRFVKDKNVLEIASGSGYGAKILAEAGAAKVTAIDIDEKAQIAAKKKYPDQIIEFITGNAENINKEDNFFDILISFETIEHLKNYEHFLSEAERVLKPDGIAIISTPNREISKGKNPFHIKEFNYDEFRAELKKYFRFCHILNQGNGIASFITTREDKGIEQKDSPEKGMIKIANQALPMYFIAICSQKEIDLLPEVYSSINSKALENIYNNPGLRLADKVYSIVTKIPGVKKIIKKLK